VSDCSAEPTLFRNASRLNARTLKLRNSNSKKKVKLFKIGEHQMQNDEEKQLEEEIE